MPDNGRSLFGFADMKYLMDFAPRFLFPLCILAYLPLACSTDDGGNNGNTPPPPGGSSSGGSSAGGSTGGGGMAAGGMSGGSAGTTTGGSGGGGTVAPGGACMKTTECQGTGFFCNTMKVCGCPANTPDVCGTGATAVCTLKAADADNCGMCGTKCDAGAVCAAGACGMKPAELTTAAGCGTIRMAIQGANLYWVETMTGKVRTMPLAGGAATDVATGQMKPTQIAADAKGVYWVVEGDGTAGSSKVMKKALPLAAGAPVVLKASAGTEKILNVTTHGDFVYYALKTDVHQISNDEKVTADLVVGTAVNYDDAANPIVSGEPTGIAVNDKVALWTTGTRSGVESHTLNAVDVASGAGYVKLAKSVGSLLFNGDVGIDAKNGYWADGEKIEVNSLTAADTKYLIVATEPESSPITAFAINATNVYAAAEDGHLFKRSLTPPPEGMNDPTPPTLVARDQMKPTSIVLDATKVYWATSDCAIRALGL